MDPRAIFMPAAAYSLALSFANFVSLAHSFTHVNRIQIALTDGNPNGDSDADIVALPNSLSVVKRFSHSDADCLGRFLPIATSARDCRAIVVENLNGLVGIG
jgi:hypothetical protein